MTGIKAGDEVRVFPLYGSDKPPATGWVAYVSAVRDDEYDARPAAWGDDRPARLTFRHADNRSTDHGGRYIARTPGCAEMRARRDAAVAVLAEHCITLQPGHCLFVEQIEALAEVAATFSAVPVPETPEGTG